MTTSIQFARIAILSLATGFIAGPAAAGEGSSDTGRPPPYGYYAGERGGQSPGGASGMGAAYGSPDARTGRTTRKPRGR
jgi:hypothetical protein